MKKTAAILLLTILLLCSCAETPYSPAFVLPDGFEIDQNTISARFVNEYFFDPYSAIECADGGTVEMYSDDTFTEYFEGGIIELEDGMNSFMLLFMLDGKHAEYRLDIYCVMILDFTVEVVSERTYSAGDEFDRSSVRVTATRENGEIFEVSDYDMKYSFDAVGKRRVDIIYGKITHSIYVDVI